MYGILAIKAMVYLCLSMNEFIQEKGDKLWVFVMHFNER